MDHVNGRGCFDVSENGTLVYVQSSEFDAAADLVWVDLVTNLFEVLRTIQPE